MRTVSTSILLSLLLLGCGIDRGGLEAARRDGGSRVDAAPPAMDGGSDAFVPDPRDGGTDGGRDAMVDAGPPPEPFCPDDSELALCMAFESHLGDGSPHGNHGTGANLAYAEGAVGSAVALGASSSLSVAHAAELSPALVLSIELWVRLDILPFVGLFSLVDKNGQYGVFVHPDGHIECSAGAAAGRVVSTAPGAIGAERWTHFACVYDGEGTETMRAYVDGARAGETGEAVGRVAEGGAALHIGENSPGGGDQVLGRIDELRIWRAARTAEQVAASAERGVGAR